MPILKTEKRSLSEEIKCKLEFVKCDIDFHKKLHSQKKILHYIHNFTKNPAQWKGDNNFHAFISQIITINHNTIDQCLLSELVLYVLASYLFLWRIYHKFYTDVSLFLCQNGKRDALLISSDARNMHYIYDKWISMARWQVVSVGSFAGTCADCNQKLKFPQEN